MQQPARMRKADIGKLAGGTRSLSVFDCKPGSAAALSAWLVQHQPGLMLIHADSFLESPLQGSRRQGKENMPAGSATGAVCTCSHTF